MKHYIIDGNNLIGKIKILSEVHRKNKQASREKLVHLLNRFQLKSKEFIYLFFDGFENISLALTKGKIIYSENKPADFFIKEEIERIKNRKNITLISSDNELKEFGRVCSCTLISSEEFGKNLIGEKIVDEEKAKIEDINNIEEWKKIFKA